MASPPSQPPADLKARLKASYDVISPAYNKWTVDHSPLRLEYLEQLLALLPVTSDPIHSLELGCGAGVPVTERLLADTRFQITGNDISTTQLATAKERFGSDRVTWLECDMMSLTFPEQSFDVVLGFYSLIHLPREEQDVLLQRIWKWLKPGGFILLNFSAEDMAGLVMEKWLGDEGWMFWSGWGADKTLEKVKEVGFEVVVGEVEKEHVDVQFLWVIGRKAV
jgi:ubiquinone/menaquinone biosynthesis C-methylase UbiE